MDGWVDGWVEAKAGLRIAYTKWDWVWVGLDKSNTASKGPSAQKIY